MNEKFAVCPCATGLGLFALEKIPPEQRLIEYTGERIAVAAAVLGVIGSALMLAKKRSTVRGVLPSMSEMPLTVSSSRSVQ